jgi:hypothetical protein
MSVQELHEALRAHRRLEIFQVKVSVVEREAG